MNVALIPARAGSKRIKNKNIRDFHGKPLLAYSIENAINSKLFDEVVVSTDSPEIAEIAHEFGATTPFIRPKTLADDHTGTRAVIEHGIDALQQLGKDFEYCCCIYATSPLLQIKYLQQGLVALQAQKEMAFAFSVTHFEFPVQRALKFSGKGLAPLYSEFVETRSQDLEPAVHDAGQFYWGRTQQFMGPKHLFSEHAIPIVLPSYLVQDIDTEEDWLRAELLYKAYLANTP